MTAATTTLTRVPAARSGWRGFGTLLRTEARLFLRDGTAVFFALVFPTVLLVGVGLAIPGMREPITGMGAPWDGLTAIATYLPIVLAAAVATPALTTMPVTFATAREKGLLRRLSTTPMRPQGVVIAHLLINLGAIAVSAVLALVVGQVVFGLAAPVSPLTVVLAFVLTVLSMLSLGMVVAAVAAKGSTASAIGNLVYFPMLFLSGMWTPGPIMPDVVRDIGQFSPLGAAAQAMSAGWFETEVPTLQLVVMAAWTAVLLPLAVRLFRWS